MKILLVGERSGVHNNFKKSLIAQGHEAYIAADGDGYKGFGYDFRIMPHKGGWFGKIKNIIYVLKNIRKFLGYDVIQFINPFAIPYYYSFLFITFIIIKANKNSVYYACGTDPAFLSSKNKFKYFPFDDIRDEYYPQYHIFQKLHFWCFLKLVDKIIPSMYSYAVGYDINPKLTAPLPLPGSGDYIKHIIPVKGRIRILFGITRKGFKGAGYILEALEKIQFKYSNEVEIAIVEKIPYQEYKQKLLSADILIDQCKSYDYGMNAIIGMENGLIVLSGNEKVAQEYLMCETAPVVNITPNPDQIFKAIEQLVLAEKTHLLSLKERSVEYVKNNHCPNSLSKRLVKLYILSNN